MYTSGYTLVTNLNKIAKRARERDELEKERESDVFAH